MDSIVPECARPVSPVTMLLELCSVSILLLREILQCRDLLSYAGLEWRDLEDADC
jgi:hypothetical protein